MDAVFHVVAGLRHVHATVQALTVVVLDVQVLPHNPAIPIHAVFLIKGVHAVLAEEAKLNAMAAAQEIPQHVAAKDGRMQAVAAEIAALSKDIAMDVT